MLLGVLGGKDDRIAGDAAWALGEIAASAPNDPHVAPLAERWLYVAQHGGWAGAIDATAALARTLAALPIASRGPFVAGDRRADLAKLAFHKSRLVRIDAVLAFASLAAAADGDALKSLAQLAHDDASPHVRAAAVIALVRLGAAAGDVGAAAIKGAAADIDPMVKAAASDKPAAPAPRSEWRSFYIVESDGRRRARAPGAVLPAHRRRPRVGQLHRRARRADERARPARRRRAAAASREDEY